MWRAGNSNHPWQSQAWLLLCIALLLAGVCFYALLRPLPWMPWPALESLAAPKWLHQGLPDGLWTAAFAAALLPAVPDRNRNVWVWWPAFCQLLLELAQAVSLWPGTADLADVVWGFAGSAVIFLLYLIKKRWSETSNSGAGR